MGRADQGPDTASRELIGACWAFYDERSGAIWRDITGDVAARPWLQPLVATLAPGTDVIDGAPPWPHTRAAILEGRWPELYAHLREVGARWASSEVACETWFELVEVFRHALERQLDEHEGRGHPARELHRGMTRFFALTTQHVMSGYVDRKTELARVHQARFRQLFEHSPQPMWTYDTRTLRFLDVNEAATRQYGYSRDEFLAMTLADIRPVEEVAALRASIERDAGKLLTVRHRRKSGEVITVQLKAANLTVDDQLVRLVVAQDVTETERARAELRKVEEQLRHAQKMEALGRLAGGVAHDFNNVLTVVSSYACMLEESLPESDERHTDAAEIRRAAERATAITERLLAMTRQGVAAPRAVELPRLIAGFATTMRRLVGEGRRVEIRTSEVPRVSIDPNHLEQVLMNLVVNARDAMPAGGRVTVETRAVALEAELAAIHGLAPGAYVELAVTDSGVGMSAATQARIFDPFFTTKPQGTGLGLAIAQGIIAQAKGAIQVHSERGQGTSVRILLPVTQEVPPPVAATPPEAPRRLPPLHVLVVEDESEIRAVTTRILQQAGCHVVEAASGEAARRLAVSHEPRLDVALVDVMLGDARGDQLADQLRELRPGLAIVLVSGFPGGVLSEREGDRPHLLAKPFSPSQLRAAIAQVAAASASGASASVTGRARTRVLLAEDEPRLRQLLTRILDRHGFAVTAVENGADAIAAVGAATFDVILSDVQMPLKTGVDLLRAARALDPDVPVILISGHPDVETAAAAVEHGAFRYLTKPVDNASVIRTIQHAARAHALARLRRQAFTSSSGEDVERAALDVRFQHALDTMWMSFQPIVDAQRGAIYGLEALLRSAEPSMPSPLLVVDAAEQLGRLPTLGRRVRELAATACAGRTDLLFVNVHPDDLLDAALVAEGAPLTAIAHRVVLEIAERGTLSSTPELARRVERLRALGFRLAVDDVGAGYSGLTAFTELQPEFVKIDLALVRDVHTNRWKQRTIRALTQLCHDLRTIVVAEGVESQHERECLVELGCDLLQGHLFGRPTREPTEGPS